MMPAMISTLRKKNVLLASGIIIVLVLIGVAVWGYLMLPSNYISLDVNPSIEIQTNRLNQVVSINPVNDDAEQVMAGYQITDNNLEVVIKDIVDRMILNGYLAADKDNEILITTDNNATDELEKSVYGIISSYLAEKQLDATLLQQSIEVEAEAIDAAHENNISAGKMALINSLIQNDSTLTVDELSGMRVSDLIDLAKSRNISLAGLMDEEQGDIDDEEQGDIEEEQGDIDDDEQGDIEEEQGDIDDDEQGDIEEEQGDIDDDEQGDIEEEQGDIDDDEQGVIEDDQDDQDDSDIDDDDEYVSEEGHEDDTGGQYGDEYEED